MKKIINLSGNTPNQLSKFRRKNLVEINDDKTVRLADKRNKVVIFKNYAPFTDGINKINNTQEK